MASPHSSSMRFTLINKGISASGRPRSAGLRDRRAAAEELKLEMLQLAPTARMGTSMLSIISAPGARAAAASDDMREAFIRPFGLPRRTNYGLVAIRCRQRAGARHAEPGALLGTAAYRAAPHSARGAAVLGRQPRQAPPIRGGRRPRRVLGGRSPRRE